MKSAQFIWEQLPQRSALQDYPWHRETEALFSWLKRQSGDMHCFIFDVMMSLAYVESTGNLVEALETCPHTLPPYHAQLGFINLCASCYHTTPVVWQFQKAAKPSSGLLGKISSEMILKFIESLNSCVVV